MSDSDIIPYVEAHTHLDHYHGPELAEALAAFSEWPCATWAVSIDLKSWARTKRLARDRPEVLPTFGIHPWEAHHYASRLDELDEAVRGSSHLGEIGLDFVWVKERDRWPLQIQVFDYFLERAARQEKVVNLHTKGAEALIAEKLAQHGVQRALVHWYSGPLAPFDALVRWGCYFSFGVELPRSEPIQAIARRCPLERILTETDGPGALEWLAGERGSPAQIPVIVSLLAELKGLDAPAMKAQIWENYRRLLALP